MMKGNKKHETFHVRLQLVLLVILICSGTLMIGTSFARYMTAGASSANAHVSSFVVEATGTGRTDLFLNASEGKNSDSYSFAVTNVNNGRICDVTANYRIVITLPRPLNSEVQMILLKDDQPLFSPVVSADGLTYTYTAGTFSAAQGDTHHFKLVFKADGAITESFAFNGIHVSVYTEQTH